MKNESWSFQDLVFREGLCSQCRELLGQFIPGTREAVSSDEGLEQSEDCGLCQGLFNELEHFSVIIQEALREHQFKTFLVGLLLDEEIIEKEKSIISEIQQEIGVSIPVALEKQLKTQLGGLLEKRTGADVEFQRPHVMAILDTRYDHVRLQVASEYIYGRYRKLERGLPQTIWHCRRCRGKGCTHCDHTGKQYQDSIQELVACYPLEVSGGSKASFHGMGREDIDARMLGNGRPFVLEIKEPKKRFFDLPALEQEINLRLEGRLEVSGLRLSDHKEVVGIKASEHAKRYKLMVTAKEPLKEEKLRAALEVLGGATIGQSTPNRVKHRRANKIRTRKVLAIEGNIQEDTGKLELFVTGESGLYIKELVHGDEGRTQPNLSQLLENQCSVDTLDVVWIHDEDTPES